ncbi:aspartate aminotransferase family protein [Leucobacter japonicus]|uniref:aspartate aminotransferase family protein n=1 Tax=Leucobacter japonicus TaxID=1461259 RepID=UPI0006A7A3C6|nr:aminotransferase class III-fold pyridoxal phosphate-dependent enzyme [Leucobacter japonicus]
MEQQPLHSLAGSRQELARASHSIPRGLVSYFRMRENQVVYTRAKGAYYWDVDDQRYIDVVSAHGPILLGHGHDEVNTAVTEAMNRAVLTGSPMTGESEFAESALRSLGWADKVTMMSTGTEAVQLAIKIARGVTGRNTIVKFQGHYHGWMDPVFVNTAGMEPPKPASGEFEPGEIPVTPFLPNGRAPEGVVIATWNDIEHFRELMERIGDHVAAVIAEPYVTNFGTFPPPASYLASLKDIAHWHGALLIFDEVVTGFRVARGGAAQQLGVSPDLGIYAKALGNGFPIAMVAGTEQVMQSIVDGRVPVAGTYSGNSLAVAAGTAVLAHLERNEGSLYPYLEALGTELKRGLESAAAAQGVPITCNQIGSLVQILWGDIRDPHSMPGVYRSNRDAVTAVMEGMIRRGVYTHRKGLFFLNAAHTETDIEQIIEAFASSLSSHLAQSAVGGDHV